MKRLYLSCAVRKRMETVLCAASAYAAEDRRNSDPAEDDAFSGAEEIEEAVDFIRRLLEQ